MVKHYIPHGLGWRLKEGYEPLTTCCGIDVNEHGWGSFDIGDPWVPKGITCPECLASERYQKDQITFEIGYDGSREKWLAFFKETHSFSS